MLLRIVLILNIMFLLSGCVGRTANVGSYVDMSCPAEALEVVAEDLADSLATAYPPGRVTVFVDGADDGLGDALDGALRSRGFTLAADEAGAAVAVSYVFDRLDGNMWYSRLSVSDGLTMTRTWRQSGGSLIAEASARTGSRDDQTR